MGQDYLIISDISADIAPEFAQAHDIRFIPMNYSVDTEERMWTGVGEEAFLKHFYDCLRANEETHTSQIPPQEYIEAFEPLMREGNSILYLSLSSGLSGTYQSACMAAEELNKKYPQAELICVDTLAATGGMGLLLEAAAQNREAGMTLRENAAWLEEKRLHVCHWFMVDDLMYLKRGGRVSAATAIVGMALNIKPVLSIVNDGTLQAIAKVRGEKNTIRHLVQYYAASAHGGENERIYIVHADNPACAAELEREVLQINPCARITVRMLTPIVGAHTGPGMCAVIHFGRQREP